MSVREVVLDTETTGLDPAEGHRVIEIGLVELENHVPTGETRQWYLNPERDVPFDSTRIHGLTNAFLADKPLFADIAEAFFDFVRDDPLVIHNAEFDLGHLNAELERVNRPLLSLSRTINTLKLARGKFPGAPASLDALCRRFEISLEERTKHGALLDARLTAEVYINLLGGRQQTLGLAATPRLRPATSDKSAVLAATAARPPRPHAPTDAEAAAHAAFVAKLKNPVWKG